MKTSSLLREQLRSGRMIVAPGAYDAIGARLIEQAGFSTAYMTGAGTSAAHGFPDFGLLTMSEMVDNASTMARAIRIPLIADGDTGYGNELNVTRTVREYEERGVAAIHIEDQASPKRCGHLDGKEIIGRLEFTSKVQAAVRARSCPDFVIIARTDARAVMGMDEALWRANAALDAGADAAFVEGPQTLAEIQAIPTRVHGPCLLNIVHGGKTPVVSVRQASEYGYRLAILPTLLLMATVEACDTALSQFRESGFPPRPQADLVELFRRFGADEWNELRGMVATNHSPVL